MNNFLGGGGFMGGMGADTSAQHESPMKRKAPAVQSLVPTTVLQVLRAQRSESADAFTVDGRPVNHVTIVGQIMQMEPGTTNIMFAIDDGTAAIAVKQWMDTNGDQDMRGMASMQWRVGQYVRVVGQIKAFNEQRSLSAYRMVAITDMNEVTYHMLDAFYTHKQAASKAAPASGMAMGPGMTAQPGAFPGNAGVMMHHQAGTPLTAHTMAGVGMGMQGSMYMGAQQNTTQQTVLQAIKTLQDTKDAVSYDDIAAFVRLPVPVVREAVSSLHDNGHVYATMDQHYRTTDA